MPGSDAADMYDVGSWPVAGARGHKSLLDVQWACCLRALSPGCPPELRLDRLCQPRRQAPAAVLPGILGRQAGAQLATGQVLQRGWRADAPATLLRRQLQLLGQPQGAELPAATRGLLQLLLLLQEDQGCVTVAAARGRACMLTRRSSWRRRQRLTIPVRWKQPCLASPLLELLHCWQARAGQARSSAPAAATEGADTTAGVTACQRLHAGCPAQRRLRLGCCRRGHGAGAGQALHQAQRAPQECLR